VSLIDLTTLLQPVTEGEPAGPDLEYDPAYLAAFRAAEGAPARQMGDVMVAAEEADWRQVGKLAAGLLARSKDLRVAVLLARALVQTHGLTGLDEGLALIHGLVERHWDTMYPQLDPEDDNDPTARVNCLLDLCDREQFLDVLRNAPLVRSRVFGPLSYRDIEVAEGRASAPPDVKPMDAAAIHGGFMECDIEELKESAAAATGALRAVSLLSDALGQRIRLDQMPSLDPLSELISAIARPLSTYLAERQPPEASTPAAAIDAAVSEPMLTAGAPRATVATEIASRDDVVRAIDRICDYYSRHEPSSPVPLLLSRARRLATGSFVDIVRDLAPDALVEIEKVCGLNKDA
jgi:type VI secretion system protein ImpA